MHALTLRCLIVRRTWQTPHYFPLVIAELSPGPQGFFATLRTASLIVHFKLLCLACNFLECADLSALCPVATCRGRGLLNLLSGRRQVAADQSGDWSPHSKNHLFTAAF
jgi:hypothetical protein